MLTSPSLAVGRLNGNRQTTEHSDRTGQDQDRTRADKQSAILARIRPLSTVHHRDGAEEDGINEQGNNANYSPSGDVASGTASNASTHHGSIINAPCQSWEPFRGLLTRGASRSTMQLNWISAMITCFATVSHLL